MKNKRHTEAEMHQARMEALRDLAYAPIMHMNRKDRRTPAGRKAVKEAEARAAKAQLAELEAEKLRLQ